MAAIKLTMFRHSNPSGRPPLNPGPSHLEVQGTLSEMIVFLSPVFVPDAEVQACLGTAARDSGGRGSAGSVGVGPSHEPRLATFDFNRLLFVPLHDVASGAGGPVSRKTDEFIQILDD